MHLRNTTTAGRRRQTDNIFSSERSRGDYLTVQIWFPTSQYSVEVETFEFRFTPTQLYHRYYLSELRHFWLGFLVWWAKLSQFLLGGSDARRNGVSDFAYDTTWAWYSLRKRVIELWEGLRYSTKMSLRRQFCWTRESQCTNFGLTLWNGMMELIDMPGMSPILRICRLGTSNPK